MPKLIDLVGRKFGRWRVRARHLARDHGATLWLCRCQCGVEKVVDGNNLRRGLSKSCGCFKRERTKQCKTTHGMSGTPAYWRWKAMRQRCLNPQNKDFAHYGGRGIGIRDDWDTFQGYYADTGEVPGPGLSLDRTDNDGWYGPSNYRWADAAVQVANRRPSKLRRG